MSFRILSILIHFVKFFFLNVIKNLSHFDQFVPSKFSINFSCVSLNIHKNQFRHKTTSISFFWGDVWCIRSSRAWSVHLWWFRGRKRASPRVKRAEFGPASEASWGRAGEWSELNSRVHKTASTSFFWGDVWCIRSSRARRCRLWWSRGENAKIRKFENSKM